MICSALHGGLGNQLFQYAAGRALALRHGTALSLDDQRLAAARRDETPRRSELHHFRVQALPLAAQERPDLRFARWLPRFAGRARWRLLAEPPGRTGDFDPRFAKAPDRTYLLGYWQSFRYFENHARAIADDLEPVAALSDQNLLLSSRIEDAPHAVAVHVRRGDYVSSRNAARYHGALSLSYYLSALDSIGESIERPSLFVFSDDPAWCRVNLPLDRYDATVVDGRDESPAWQDLVLMSRCRHHVIANSSFSWWGAWLADRRFGERRRVIAPERWFTDPQWRGQDRFPRHWEALAS